jgi:hypothetical protein
MTERCGFSRLLQHSDGTYALKQTATCSFRSLHHRKGGNALDTRVAGIRLRTCRETTKRERVRAQARFEGWELSRRMCRPQQQRHSPVDPAKPGYSELGIPVLELAYWTKCGSMAPEPAVRFLPASPDRVLHCACSRRAHWASWRPCQPMPRQEERPPRKSGRYPRL